MPSILFACPHCANPSRIDPDTVPDQPAFFPCPFCAGRVVVDKQKLMGEQEAAPSPAPAAGPAADNVTPDPPAPPQGERPAAAPPPITPPAVEPTVPDRRFTTLPPDATLPSGIIVGEEESVISEVRKVLAAVGSEVERVESPEAARQMIVNEQPDLCIYVAGRIDTAPHPALTPLTGLHPSFRRQLYLMLIADNVKTFDGIAAFVHQVNLIMARRDLPRLGAALHSGLEYHKRLYKTFLEASEHSGRL